MLFKKSVHHIKEYIHKIESFYDIAIDKKSIKVPCLFNKKDIAKLEHLLAYYFLNKL